MSKFVKYTKKMRKDLEDISNMYKKMFDTITYINPNLYHFLDEKCNCDVCKPTVGNIYMPRFKKERV